MKRGELVKAIEWVMAGVDKDGSPLGMDFLVFDRGWLRSFNDTISVSLKTGLPDEVEGAVKARELYKVTSMMEGDTIRVVREKEALLIKNSRTTLKMSLMEDKQLGVLTDRLKLLSTDDLEWIPITEKFMGGLDLCKLGSYKSPVLGSMAGVAYQKKKMYSTDTQRISIYNVDNDLGEEDFIIPYGTIVDILKYGKEATDISITNSWLHFKAPNDTVISVRKLIGDYPYAKIEEVFQEHSIKDKKEKPLIFPEGIDKSLDRVEILSSADTDLGTMPLVTLVKEGKFLIIRGEKDVGKIEEKIPWESEAMPEGTEIKISPEFLKKTLKITREFWISPTKNSIIFNAPDFKHLMVVKVG